MSTVKYYDAVTPEKPKLSIIMPAFNEERTISQSIESILFQKTIYIFELIVVDDCSTDRTAQIAENFEAHYPQVKVLRNERNLGKGQSVMRAYELARGKYFHVLDGDDFFVSWEKLEKQIKFLDNNREFFAVAHNTAMLHGNGELSFIRETSNSTKLDYKSCIGSGFYCHTSSYMFRKAGERLPQYFNLPAMRGDTALFFYHAFQHKSQVQYYSDVASVYNFHGDGLWSGLDRESRAALNIRVLEALRDHVVDDPAAFEHSCLEKHIAYARRDLEPASAKVTRSYTLDEILTFCTKAAARVFEPAISAKAFRAMYSMPLVDQLCELIGRIIMFKNNLRISNRVFDEHRIAILASGFVPNGGGVFREIKELIKIHLEGGFSVDIYSSGKIPTATSVIEEHFNHPKISYWEVASDEGPSSQLEKIIIALYKTAPTRIYPFITHHDAVLSGAMQRGLSKNIIFDFVYDHGLSLGIHNTSIDKIIVKTQSQASALASVIDSKKFLLIPPFIGDKYGFNPYRPLKKGTLTTASAAARSYKIENNYEYSYFNIVPEILKRTGGVHYHYGPLQDESKRLILHQMQKANLDVDRFIHVPWADDFGGSLLENGVDIFLPPFPVCSARIAIEVMSCGIPSINHNVAEPKLPQAIDFVDSGQWTWNEPTDLFKTIESLSYSSLEEKSASARRYFRENNDVAIASESILNLNGRPLSIENRPMFVISDIMEEGLIKADLPFFRFSQAAESNADLNSVVNNENFVSPSLRRRTRPVRRKIKAFWQSFIGPLHRS